MVAAHEGGEACVCDLTEPLGLTQPTISRHLKILVGAGIFTRDKRGVWAYYALVPAAMKRGLSRAQHHLLRARSQLKIAVL
jgi:ArsR family transcriptional regulator